jgi:DNA helicase II / ATP-dependent DNA helicase PcrA
VYCSSIIGCNKFHDKLRKSDQNLKVIVKLVEGKMDTKRKIVDFLRRVPNSKARYIAGILGIPKREVNQCLYEHKGKDFVVDELYRWSLVQSFRNETLKVVTEKYNTEILKDIDIPFVSQIDYDDQLKLDKYQMSFIQSKDKNLRLLAPAGSGKTTALLYRCKYLYEKKMDPNQTFLIITFTNVAKDALENKLSDQNFANIKNKIQIQTLNSWGLSQIKLPKSNFLGKSFSASAIQKALRSSSNTVVRRFGKIQNIIHDSYSGGAKKVAELIDMLKSLGFDHEHHKNFLEFQKHYNFLALKAKVRYLADVFELLEQLKLIDKEDHNAQTLYSCFFPFWAEITVQFYKDQVISFEDQKYWAYREILKSPNISLRISHIIVDEFQDINPLDAKLIKLIADKTKSSITVVGDDDQSIFEWRGAVPYYILNPQEIFGRTFTSFTLSLNYRCPQNITAHSVKLINRNKIRYPKEIISKNPRIANVHIEHDLSAPDRYKRVMEIVKKMHKNEKSVTLVARLRMHLLPYQVLLVGEGLNFIVDEDLNFFDNEPFRALEHIILNSYPDQYIPNITRSVY